MKKKIILYIAFLLAPCAHTAKSQDSARYLPKWEEGFLDIHHINTGRGDNAYMVFPDGTTMIFDAGNLGKQHLLPLKITNILPSDTLTPAGWIKRYIDNGSSFKPQKIDYALISHFHLDHYGSFVDLSKLIPFETTIDRNYPNYDYPLDLASYLHKDSVFQDYLRFTQSHKVESLRVGSSSQIRLKYKPDRYKNFSVINVKANARIWTGKGETTVEYFKPEEMVKYYKGGYNENPLSMAILIRYGKFTYYTGGDNTGLSDYDMPSWFDVETPIAQAVGKVDVATLDHHGNRDGTNWNFVKMLNPKVIVQQLWCSDHPGQEVYQRLIYQNPSMEKRDIFSTNMHPETLITYGPWFSNSYKSMQGHIVIRVYPKGETYKVYILDEATLQIKKEFGPYTSSPSNK